MSETSEPTKRKRTSAISLPLEERQRRYRLAEELLSRVFSETRVAAELMRQVPCSNGQARRLIDLVKAGWLAASIEDPDARRSRLRAAGEAIYTAAMTRTAPVLDAKGLPVIDRNTGRPVREPQPDLKQATQVVNFLARLDGLMLQQPEDGGAFLSGLTAVIDAARKAQAIDATPRRVLGNGSGNGKINGANGHGANAHGNGAHQDDEDEEDDQ